MVLGKIYHSLVILAIFGMLVGFELLVKVCVIGMLINTVVLLYYMIKGEQKMNLLKDWELYFMLGVASGVFGVIFARSVIFNQEENKNEIRYRN